MGKIGLFDATRSGAESPSPLKGLLRITPDGRVEAAPARRGANPP
jgi:hypothetical protein